MKVLLLQLDGTLPNIALMKIAAHHRAMGDSVELRRADRMELVERQFSDDFGAVYASTIFERTRAVAERVKRVYPAAFIGGTGWDEITTLEGIGIATKEQDYSLYPDYRHSIGYTQRGCRFKCSFCKVPRTEPGKVKSVSTVGGIWRGEPHPREIVLLDNDFFGQKTWLSLIEEMRDGRFKVCFSQGINARIIRDEQAAAIASVNYRDDSMKVKRIYTAWDNRQDEDKLFHGLELLVKHGVKPDHLMVYVLIGYDHDTKQSRPTLDPDDLHRHRRLRDFGARPYPMPFVRSRELVGFQTWIVGAYDKTVTWDRWKRANYNPRRLGKKTDGQGTFEYTEGAIS